MPELRRSTAYWRRECNLSTERSRERRQEDSPHPWPDLRGWLIAAVVVAVTLIVGYLFQAFFGVGAWS